jgi:hypothetical protein
VLISTSALFDNITWVLENEIAPAVQDQPWLASYLRSITGLLPYLSTLSEAEGRALYDDNLDLRTTLRAIADAGVLTEDITDTLAAASTEGYQSVAELHTENERYRTVLDRAIHSLHAQARNDVLPQVREYLQRGVQRSAPLYGSLGMIPF